MIKHLIPHLAKSVVAGAFSAATVLALAITVTPFTAGPGASEEIMSSITRGAQLYDKWYKLVDFEAPDTTHPSYPSDAKKAGASTWRCKECHGWDYKGADGAYGSGSHYTGIKGINGMAGADPADIIDVLMDDTHAYADKMVEEDFKDLANFVSLGQINTDKLVDPKTKLPIGANAANGEIIFNSTCARCHRVDGTRPKDMEDALGAQMGNPWEVMHKVMNGHPGQNMPSFRVFGDQVVVDVLAHMLTLPKEK